MYRPLILQTKDMFYPILAVFGFPANLLTIIVLSRGKCGLSKCISAYMMIMAVSDLSVININVVLYKLLINRLSHTFLHHTNFLIAIVYLMGVSLELSQWCTVAFTVDRYVAMCCQKFKTKYCRVKTMRILAALILILISLENIPHLFVFQPLGITGNISWGIEFRLEAFNSPAFVAFTRLKSFRDLFCVFGLIFLFNGLTVRHILVSSKSRRGFRSQWKENRRDTEMESRRKSIVLLFSVSVSFLLLWLPATVTHFIAGHTMHSDRDYSSPELIAALTGALLAHLSSWTNTWPWVEIPREDVISLSTLRALNNCGSRDARAVLQPRHHSDMAHTPVFSPGNHPWTASE
ncbi:probable G-protein coupled receptor 139 [Pristis pectinata]|uniref:probable G-protein coupled receptor 139 n=1 Tax=Pristis pectinata TaxID=685728 RepID=UPI00223E408F|nr:probable G-protein coupled receptor 139 [Pristis pectinata]